MSTEPPAAASGPVWARAFAVVAVVALLVAAGLYVFTSLRDLPGDAVDRTLEVVDEVRSVAASFRQGTITTSFVSYATTLSGSNYFQFATLRQTEVFTREDRASVLWGQFELPEVVVSATAPVEYTAYLDLDAEWRFELADGVMEVVAPEIRFNKPAIDASEIRYDVPQSSLLRDEEEALRKLKAGLTAMSEARAADQVPLVRELGRSKTREFVENWLARGFDDGESYTVRVRFADEVADGGLRTGVAERPGQ